MRTILLVMSITGCLPASAATRHIVLLFDERIELPGLSLLEAEFVHTLRFDATEPVEVYREAMDLSRFNSKSYKTHLRDFLSAKYADKKVDVAVAIMAPALDETTWCSLPPSEHVRCPNQERVCTDTRTRASPPSRDRRRGGRFRKVRFRRRTSLGASQTDVTQAKNLFDRALQLDPDNVEAMIGKAGCSATQLIFGWSASVIEDTKQASELIDRALSKCGGNPRAHTVKGTILSYEQPVQALAEYNAALGINLNFHLPTLARHSPLSRPGGPMKLRSQFS